MSDIDGWIYTPEFMRDGDTITRTGMAPGWRHTSGAIVQCGLTGVTATRANGTSAGTFKSTSHAMAAALDRPPPTSALDSLPSVCFGCLGAKLVGAEKPIPCPSCNGRGWAEEHAP